MEHSIRSRSKPIIREHTISTPDSKPYIAVEGPDGNLWFCESGASKIGCFDTFSCTFREFDLPSADSTPIGIDVGADGNLWFTEKTGNRIGRLSRRRSDHGICAADRSSRTRRHRAWAGWKHLVFCRRYRPARLRDT